MTLQPRRLLWLLIGLLSACLAAEWLWPDGGAAPPAAPLRIGGRHAPAQTVPERDTAGWGDTVLARPLFSTSRRPPRVVASTRSDAAPSQARLAGIMITRYGKRAIFAPDGGGKQLILPEGAAINDSTISRIQPDRVTLASGTVLLPSFDKNRVGPIPTTPPFQPAVAGAVGGVFPPPGLPNPGIPNPALLNPNFGNPNFPGMPGGLPPQAQNPAAAAGDDANPQAPAQPAPVLPQMMRGTMIPPRREQ